MMLAPAMLEDDPDVAQAIDDLKPVVAEMLDLLDKANKARPESLQGFELMQAAGELRDLVALRASRLAMSTVELVELVSSQLKPTNVAATEALTKIRELISAVVTAERRERNAHQQINFWQARLRTLTRARLAAEQALAAYSAGRAGR